MKRKFSVIKTVKLFYDIEAKNQEEAKHKYFTGPELKPSATCVDINVILLPKDEL